MVGDFNFHIKDEHDSKVYTRTIQFFLVSINKMCFEKAVVPVTVHVI